MDTLVRALAATRPHARLCLVAPSRALAAVPQRKRGTGVTTGGKGGVKGKGRPAKKEAEPALSREAAGYLDVLRKAAYGDGTQERPKRSADELAEMQASAKAFSRATLYEERVRIQRLGELLRLKHAATAALPPALRAEAETPFEELPWHEKVMPYDVLKPSETPPIDDFQAKVAAAEAAIMEELAVAQREGDAQKKRAARAERAGEGADGPAKETP
jgi:hypothetical protein